MKHQRRTQHTFSWAVEEGHGVQMREGLILGHRIWVTEMLWGKTAREPGLGDTLPYAPPRCPGGPASRLALPRPSLGTLPLTGLCKNHRSRGQVLLPPGGHTVPTVTRTWGPPSGSPLEGAPALACNFSPRDLSSPPGPYAQAPGRATARAAGPSIQSERAARRHTAQPGDGTSHNTRPHTGGQCHHARVSWPHFPHR